MDKATLRKQAWQQRQALSDDEVENLSLQIINRLTSHISWQKFHTVHIYLADAKRKEIATWPIIHYLWDNQPHIRVVTNRMNTAEQIDCYEITPDSHFAVGRWGLLEPCANTQLIEPTQIDLMILPLLACDRRGYRLGYGKGFYDQLLSRCAPTIHRIGMNYFSPLSENIAAEAHDIPLQQLILPSELVSFAAGEMIR